jgi:hypothetical protein
MQTVPGSADKTFKIAAAKISLAQWSKQISKYNHKRSVLLFVRTK